MKKTIKIWIIIALGLIAFQGGAQTPVCVPVTIGTQPSQTSMCTSGSASFSVVANGTAPFTYQWQYATNGTWVSVVNGTPSGAVYSNQTTATLNVAGINILANPSYRCVITNCSGNTATSVGKLLLVNTAPDAPIFVIAGGTSSTNAGVEWSPKGSPATSFTIRYRVIGTSIWTLTEEITNDNTFGMNLTKLSPNTTYEVQVQSNNSCGSSAYSASANFTTLPVVGNYCTAAGTNFNSFWVAGVKVNGLSQTSTKAGYTDFTPGGLAIMVPAHGLTSSVTLTPGTSFTSTSYPVYWRVWIDYNKDDDFNDAGETVISQSSTNLVALTKDISYNPAYSGAARMRVAMSYGTTIPEPCGTFAQGEVEDYTVNLSPPIQELPTDLSINTITSTSATAQCWSPPFATSYSWRYRKVGTTTWLMATTSIENYNMTSLTPSTQYEVQVSASNVTGSSDYTNSVTFTTNSGSVPTYCTAKGNNSSYMWIEGISLNGITKTSGAAGYSNFTNIIFKAVAGTTTYMSLNPGAVNSYGVEWRVWIDLNKDGDFADSGESKVSVASNSLTTISAALTLSSGVTGSTRMRVRMRYLGTTTDPAIACGNIAYGEVEDYIINIAPAPALKNISTDGTETSGIENAGTELTVYPNPANEVINFNINLKDESVQSVTVMDVLGKSIIELNASSLNSNQISIARDDMPNGVYFLRVRTNNGNVFSNKFMITK